MEDSRHHRARPRDGRRLSRVAEWMSGGRATAPHDRSDPDEGYQSRQVTLGRPSDRLLRTRSRFIAPSGLVPHPSYRRLTPGDFPACTVLHEFAYVVVPCAFPGRPFRSHGPEFVRCYVELLGLVMPTHMAQSASAVLVVDHHRSTWPRPSRREREKSPAQHLSRVTSIDCPRGARGPRVCPCTIDPPRGGWT